MESKVKEYLEVYGKFEGLAARTLEFDGPQKELLNEIQTLEERKKGVDYRNPDIILTRMEGYIDNIYNQKVSELADQVEEEMARINNPSGKVQGNFDKVCKWLGRDNVVSFVKETPVDFSKPISIEKAEDASAFNTATSLNRLFGFIFRFDFLAFLPKIVRIIIAVFAWGFILDRVRFNIFIIPAIIAANIIAYVISKSSAKQYMVDNHAACLALISPLDLKDKLFDYRLSEFKNNVASDWYQEMNDIKVGGIASARENDPNAIYPGIKAELEQQYNQLCSQIGQKEASVASLESEKAEAIQSLMDIVPLVREKEDGVDNLIGESEHNNGIISPYVPLGFATQELLGVKKLIHIKHDVKPVIICYSEQTARNGEQFRKNIARVVEQMMNGFYYENYYGFINMSLVDFESLHFPESRTKGLMKVIRSREELNKLFNELKETRKIVDSSLDGKIASINPDRLKNKENPVKYNIVYFVGYDFSGFDNETSQLFVGGETFGFVPFIFMGQDEARTLLNEDISTKSFARVIRKASDAGQIYSLESIVEEFIYEVVVTNRPELANEKIDAKRIITYDAFKEEANSGKYDDNSAIYIDVCELDENLYNKLIEQDSTGMIRFFTFDGKTPPYIDSSKVMFL